ncbi:uncharacterized protein [Aegilops tauschii subsp. strangulata]|uniref:uncharacterized protein n=1 Tax=Aegilops tauschii subsp. strangulata TaxID=200361 RepID=UPI003CC8C33E
MRGCERCRLYKKNLAKVHNYRKATVSPALRGNQIRKKHTHRRKEDAPIARVALHGAAIHRVVTSVALRGNQIHKKRIHRRQEHTQAALIGGATHQVYIRRENAGSWNSGLENEQILETYSAQLQKS